MITALPGFSLSKVVTHDDLVRYMTKFVTMFEKIIQCFAIDMILNGFRGGSIFRKQP